MPMNVRIEEGWKKVLAPEFDKFYFETLTDFVRKQYQQGSLGLLIAALSIGYAS